MVYLLKAPAKQNLILSIESSFERSLHLKSSFGLPASLGILSLKSSLHMRISLSIFYLKYNMFLVNLDKK